MIKRFMFEISILHPNEYIKWEVTCKGLKLKNQGWRYKLGYHQHTNNTENRMTRC